MYSKIVYDTINITEIMYGFCVEDFEDCVYPSKLKLYIPEIFPDKSMSKPDIMKMPLINSITLNDIKLSQDIEVVNYIELPIMTSDKPDMVREILSTKTYTVNREFVIKGKFISYGDRFIVLFPNKNIKNGIILGRG